MNKLIAIFLIFSFSAIANEIKIISDNEFEYKNSQGETKKIVIKEQIGKVNHIAVIRKAEYTRFLIRTNDGNYHIHYESYQIPDSPLATFYKKLSDNQLTPIIDTKELYNLTKAGSPNEPTPNLRCFMVTTPLSKVQRSSSGDECIIHPVHINKAFVAMIGGIYSIITEASFK